VPRYPAALGPERSYSAGNEDKMSFGVLGLAFPPANGVSVFKWPVPLREFDIPPVFLQRLFINGAAGLGAPGSAPILSHKFLSVTNEPVPVVDFPAEPECWGRSSLSVPGALLRTLRSTHRSA